MRSTFMGLETAKRAMFTQQGAIYTTGHNIANVNTPGFSRQRVNFVQTEPYPTAAMNRPQIPGQMGTGVEAGSVQRMRESFLDIQYRNENNKLGYWESRATALSKMEDIMNEPSEDGLAAVMGEFWKSLQDLAGNPENEGARKVVLQRGQAVADTFHYLHDSLTSIKKDFGNEISVNLKEINSLTKQIADLNRQIGEVEPHGYLPNDLYDERDRLVDELSQHVNIKVTKEKSGGKPLDIAEGSYHIKLIGADGSEVDLVRGSEYNQLGFATNDQKLSYDVPGSIENIDIFDSKGNQMGDSIKFVENDQVIFSQGKLRGLIESYGYTVKDQDDKEVIKGIYPEMMDDLDKLAFTFGTLFNEVHKKGYPLEASDPDWDTSKNKDFFNGLNKPSEKDHNNAAKTIQLNPDLGTKDIAASTKGSEKDGKWQIDAGDGKHAINLSNISNWILSEKSSPALEGFDPTETVPFTDLPIKNGSINSFYEGMIGKLGVDALQANRLSRNSTVLRQSVEENRQSVSSVSLDEEFTNLIKFQHAYNAAARQITAVDEMLDTIINGMGRVGR
ncbi:flagellar hook-associated protein 1 FlgK [Oikeobacillus pervagus]|uniref:Flagellar hook-associated protein 1 n=1 Tax=Oikeobacillus pervagus TaxID=1325931 RepID=A0AAJ1T4A3_9BACI|nr:flagellar hook-associated protein FlgK [Oikeobacillus pervagus]MDQ0214956.1 flagellar hook-associated protein 1 FlgK [Oikeobacillus pervagus]